MWFFSECKSNEDASSLYVKLSDIFGKRKNAKDIQEKITMQYQDFIKNKQPPKELIPKESVKFISQQDAIKTKEEFRNHLLFLKHSSWFTVFKYLCGLKKMDLS